MRTMKFLMCVACLSSAAVFARTAMTQETPVDPQVTDRLVPTDERQNLPPFQEPGPLTRLEAGPMEERLRPRRVTRTVIETLMEPIPKEELDASKKLQAAIQSLRTGKDEAARKVSADVIQQQLTTQFENDLKQREKELSEVEQRVKTLREQLDKRKAAKAEIINLRLQTLVNEANGLGFPDQDFGTVDPFTRQRQFSPTAERRFSTPDLFVPDRTPTEPEPIPPSPVDPS